MFLSDSVAPDGELVVTVKPGSSLGMVSERLHKDGIISDPLQFRLLARWKGVATRIHSGDYLFSEAATPVAVLQRLVEGDVRRIRLTIPEGFTLREIATRVERRGLGDAERFLRACSDPRFLNALEVTAASLEGHLFPETYLFEAGRPETDLIRAMVAELDRNLSPELLAKAEKQNLNRYQLLTLASIVQKEAGNVAEMPRIAAVFHNRLKRGIPLQADPTVIYGIADFDGNLTRAHLKDPGPYNTYVNRGLPPGPICNPGLDALRATAAPADTRDLYFVARGDGTHKFSTTLKEHNRAVRRYQLRR